MNDTPIVPSDEDFSAVEAEHGPARSMEEAAQHYRLAQARALIRRLAEKHPHLRDEGAA
jgi:hypothetical protein